ncbi:DNase I-like protein [Fomitopsis serialis]|uniref:DNase I-like protein n=1 Tax=Fomitopsis serialis TaxID=139415 RepID=UPI002007BC50|nr:DNase I-like protein [Neoantrodia serialis]KAH9931574.1 DNase I-like protein [Neoantrodia serialis]
MSDKLKLVVQGLLRPSEVVKAAIEARLVSSEDKAPDGSFMTRAISPGRIRVDGGYDQVGDVLVIKMASGPPSSKTSYTFERAFPISDGFSISMAQTSFDRLDPARQSGRPPSSTANTAFALTIVADGHPEAERLTLLTRDSEGLKSLLEEYRRCKESRNLQAEPDYSWLAAYIGHPSRPAILSSVPPDLRMLQKPVHTLLSPASAGLPGDEAFDTAVIRDDWIRRRVKDHLLAHAEQRSRLRIRVGTFNVNGKMPIQDLSSWLRHGRLYESFIPPLKEISPLSLSDLAQSPMSTGTVESPLNVKPSAAADVDDKARVAENQDDPDLLVLAFQELDLSAEALLYSTKTVREDAWCTAAFAALGEKAVLYEKLVSKQLVGMLLLVIVQKRLKGCFGDVRSASIGAGIMGMMGNKGATAIRMTYTPNTAGKVVTPRPITLTFVNSHLAAFDEMFDRRNADFHDICKRLLFESGATAQEPSPQDDVPSENSPITLNVFETDVLFWTVKLQMNLPDADVRYLLSSSQELYLAQRMRKAFENFKEHPIQHAPSYRLTSDGLEDELGYDMRRKPAWTDRILHTHSAMVDVKQFSYTSHPDISMSDHKPVSADFDVRAASLDATSFEEFVQDLWRQVGSVEESEQIPWLRVSTTFIDVGSFSYLSYHKPTQQSLHIENVGKIPCTYRFVAAKPGSELFPEWLETDQVSGLLLPGESTVVHISTRIQKALATKLNISRPELTHTLILHTAMGKDHFITVVAKYERTCFCNHLHMLARLPGPIRALKSLGELLPADHAVTAPREVMRLINWLMTNATNVEGLFVQAGDSKLVDTICEVGVRGRAGIWDAFIRFLRLLPEPVVPVNLFARCTEVSSKDSAFELLEDLPAVNLNVWISTTAVLHFIVQQAASAARIEQLVAVFTSVLLPDDPTADTSPSATVRGKRAFLRYFIL